jgi:hypothetical protein
MSTIKPDRRAEYRYRKALKKILEQSGCTCGGDHPDNWARVLPDEDNIVHTSYCPLVIAYEAFHPGSTLP